MEYVPVGKRTRFQKSLKYKEFKEEREFRKKKRKCNGRNWVPNSGICSSDDDEACVLVDESEFLKALSAARKSEKNSSEEVVGVSKFSNLGKFHNNHDDDDDGENSVGLEEDKDNRIMNDDGYNDAHDVDGNGSVPSGDDDYNDAHDDGTNIGDGDGNGSVPSGDADDDIGHVNDDHDDDYAPLGDDNVAMDDDDNNNDIVSVDEADDNSVPVDDEDDASVSVVELDIMSDDDDDDDDVHTVDDDIVNIDRGGVDDGDGAHDDDGDGAHDDDGDHDGDDDDGKREKCEPNVEFQRRVFEGMLLPMYIAKSNDKEDNFIGKRTRSHFKHKSSSRINIKEGTCSAPITIDIESSSSSSDSSPSSSSNEDEVDEHELKPEIHKRSNEVVKRKRESPSKNKDDNKSNEVKPRVNRQKTSEVVQSDLMNAILENDENKNEPRLVSYVPLKFRYGVDKVEPKISQEEQELKGLFNEMDFALGVCDIGLQTCYMNDKKDENTAPHGSAILNKKLCQEGKHFWIHDEEIGIKCKFCLLVKLEARYVMPDFNKDPFGKREGGNRYCGQFPYNNTNTDSERFQYPESSYDSRGDPTPMDVTQEGTVWDLIPGTKRELYPHQRDGFEFIWKNIAGGIVIEELGNLTGPGTGGCIICHAPGTGKSRLAIVFLQSFMKKYPNSKPIILAPYSMLRTWEDEFVRWNVNIPFYNLNEKELSGNEDCALLKACSKQRKNLKNENVVRMIKLDTWKKGNGVLAVSYGLFQRLAHKQKDNNNKKKVGGKGVKDKIKQVLGKKMRRALLEEPDILVLDEGHTPRNENSSIFKVLSKVSTKRRVMLSGTPFQNNFEELHNTIALVREEFGVPCGTPLVDDDVRNIKVLRKQFEPFVHVHKGEILRDTLPGLFHSLVVLRPSELQKMFFARLATVKSKFVKFDNMVSVTSVHPSIFCKKETGFIDKEHEALLEKNKNDLDAGVKTRFLIELIKLCKGERVLVFGQYLPPLMFVGDLLKSLFQWTNGRELLYMYGNQEMKERQSLINLFNDPNSEARVLLASTKACCEGISLVGASRVVLLDVVWNPSVERQAISRAYRLGQNKDVFVYHLITAGTLEEEKYRRQTAKERFGEMLFSSTSSSSSSAEGGIMHKQQGTTESIRPVLKDYVLEEMLHHDKTKYIFEKTVCQPKTDDLITGFGPRSM